MLDAESAEAQQEASALPVESLLVGPWHGA
jgi:hypothetical protein